MPGTSCYSTGGLKKGGKGNCRARLLYTQQREFEEGRVVDTDGTQGENPVAGYSILKMSDRNKCLTQ